MLGSQNNHPGWGLRLGLLAALLTLILAGLLWWTEPSTAPVHATPSPSPGEDTLQRAARLLAQGRWRAARAAYEAVLRREGPSPEILWQLARLWAAEDPVRARAYVQRLLALPQVPNRYQAPAQHLERALTRALAVEHPAYQLVEAGRGLARLGDWALAREAWRRAVDMTPGYAPAWAYLGQAEARLGNPQRAWEAWHRARLLAPNDPLPPFLMGLQALEEGRPYEAAGWLSRAVALRPAEPVFRYHLARALAQREGFFHQAWSQVTRLVAMHPQDPIALQLAARFAIEHRVHLEDAALPWLRRAYTLNPQDGTTLLLLAWAYQELGQPDLAMRFLQKAQALAPEDPRVLHMLALWYQSQGQEASAQRYREQARRAEAPLYLTPQGLETSSGK